MMKQDEIIELYLSLSAEKKQLPNIYRFSNWTQIPISDLKAQFGDAEQIQAAIWLRMQNRCLKALASDPDFEDFPIADKLLAYHFTFLQIASEYRSFIQLKNKKLRARLGNSPDMMPLKQNFLIFVNRIVEQGQESGEIAKRILIGNKLTELVWYQKIYILQFWSQDNSPMYELSDAAVEKSTQWVFDILGRNFIDSSIDFGRFFLQNIKLKRPFFE